MDDFFRNSVEVIAYLQYKADESIYNLNKLKSEILNHKGNLSLDKKLEIIAMVEQLLPEINDVIQARIYAIKKLGK